MKKYLLVPMLVIIAFAVAFAASSGPNNPATFYQFPVGDQLWSNESYISASDDNYATVQTVSDGETSRLLLITNYGFSLPACTIDGIQVGIERKASASDASYYVYDEWVSLVIGDSADGDNKANTTTKWTTSDGAYVSYGNSTDKWGLTPTESQVEATGFGVALQVELHTDGIDPITAYVDHVRITVWYTSTETPAIKRKQSRIIFIGALSATHRMAA